jgi:hypothetical protein
LKLIFIILFIIINLGLLYSEILNSKYNSVSSNKMAGIGKDIQKIGGMILVSASAYASYLTIRVAGRYAPRRYAPRRYAPRGYAPRGYAPRGYAEHRKEQFFENFRVSMRELRVEAKKNLDDNAFKDFIAKIR